MSRLLWRILALLPACGTAVKAHEYWACLEDHQGQLEMRICSGHAFPESDLLLAERLLAETAFVRPDGVVVPVKPVAANKYWRAEFAAEGPGVWTAAFALKRPPEEEPFFRGRCLRVRGGADDPARYAMGKGLEIVPQAPLSRLKEGEAFAVALRWDGHPIEGKIMVTPENGSVMFFSTGRQRPAELKLPKAGWYLLTASHGGKSFALTIQVPDGAAEDP